NRGSSSVYYVRNTALKTFAQTNGEADVITRMCFGADGYGYALTNDASHLIRFSSGEKITIVDLGAVQDGKNNNGISIRNLCTSWGGDMIADAFGNLYIISMRGNVFKMNPQTMVADHVATIKNIPQDYTINGAAVDAKGDIIVTCATKTDHYYSVNIATWEATVLQQQQGELYNASDLASCNFAYGNLVNTKPAETVKSVISVYPNPAVNKTVNVSFEGVTGNKYTVQVVDGNGNNVYSKSVSANGKTVSQIILPGSAASGIYIVKVVDSNGKEQYSGKIVVY
ncbi:MAG TPA: T9SS type A sorting domain-containing protein, partial [Panacibacter sp.]|nr:T9SS type A sorting domain-containing protein [Panacibacter sp.]